MIKTRIITSMLMLICSGCLPCPHFEVKVPTVTGNITRDDKPLSGATIRISEEGDWSCNQAVAAISRTDTVGNFDLKEKKEFRFIRSFIGDPYYINQLCIIIDQEVYLGYLARGVGYPPERLHIKCRINQESRPVTEKTPKSEIYQYAVCTPDT